MPMKYLKGVATLKIDDCRCSGCGMCLMVCPHQVIRMKRGIAYVHDLDACMECGACKTNCPEQAIGVQAGVGCAYAIVRGMIYGTPPSCGCGEEPSSPCQG
jgi:NAD-dependent dihydropyrimidine dehydrogenase PreA subunit